MNSGHFVMQAIDLDVTELKYEADIRSILFRGTTRNMCGTLQPVFDAEVQHKSVFPKTLGTVVEPEDIVDLIETKICYLYNCLDNALAKKDAFVRDQCRSRLIHLHDRLNRLFVDDPNALDQIDNLLGRIEQCLLKFEIDAPGIPKEPLARYLSGFSRTANAGGSDNSIGTLDLEENQSSFIVRDDGIEGPVGRVESVVPLQSNGTNMLVASMNPSSGAIRKRSPDPRLSFSVANQFTTLVDGETSHTLTRNLHQLLLDVRGTSNDVNLHKTQLEQALVPNPVSRPPLSSNLEQRSIKFNRKVALFKQILDESAEDNNNGITANTNENNAKNSERVRTGRVHWENQETSTPRNRESVGRVKYGVIDGDKSDEGEEGESDMDRGFQSVLNINHSSKNDKSMPFLNTRLPPPDIFSRKSNRGYSTEEPSAGNINQHKSTFDKIYSVPPGSPNRFFSSQSLRENKSETPAYYFQQSEHQYPHTENSSPYKSSSSNPQEGLRPGPLYNREGYAHVFPSMPPASYIPCQNGPPSSVYQSSYPSRQPSDIFVPSLTHQTPYSHQPAPSRPPPRDSWHSAPNNSRAPEHSPRRRNNPVPHWKVKFSGNTGSISLKQFLGEISLLARADQVSEEELLSSAILLFEGPAKVWFLAFHQSFQTWGSVIEALKQQFLPHQWDSKLLREMNDRRQGEHESFRSYYAIMQTYFQRLNVELSEGDKIKIVRENLQPEYQRAIGLGFRPCSLVDLAGRCLEFEEIEDTIERKSKRGLADILEPSLQCRRVGFVNELYDESPPIHEQYEEQELFALRESPRQNSFRSRRPFSAPTNQPAMQTSFNPQVLPLRCWNCDQPGHPFYECSSMDRRVFCYGCGELNTVLPKCTRCMERKASGNARGERIHTGQNRPPQQ